ncbi:MAG: ComEA family DNA-binding protein, partial [Flammeovirgaceae bacterium]
MAIILALMIDPIWTICQDIQRKEIDPSTLVDEIFAMQDVNISYQDLYENYLQLLSNPLDLNQITDEQLRSLYLLDAVQIQSFLKYRTENGPFVSTYELQTIPAFTPELIERLAPFVTVNDPTAVINQSILKRIFQTQNNYLILRWARTIESQRGYASDADSTTRYAGSPDQLYARFRAAKAGDFSVGFTLEKDAGESMLWNPAKKYFGFDYVSFHAQAINKGNLKNIIVGDYQAQFGQGIALGSVFGIGKNGETVTTTRRSNLGFSPYTSLYEAGYFRGAAITYQVTPQLFLHTMYSNRGRDGNLTQDTLQSTGVVSSFNYSGLHRTPNELANRNSTAERNAASVLNFKNNQIDAGLLIHQTIFSAPLQRSP